MSKNNHLPSSLPDMTHDFMLDSVGKISKHRWVGDFTCKIPNTKDKCLIGKHQAFLNGKMAEFLDVGTLDIHQKVAYLRFTLLEYPKFWRDSDLGYELVDHNVIEDVYVEVLAFEKKWLKEVWGDEYEETDGNEGTDAKGSGDGEKTGTESDQDKEKAS